jgi:spore maturation protein CgeB
VVCLHYSTDDPWNPGQRAEWFLRSLPLYDIVFTPRTSNRADFNALGCQQVRHLPFGYDDFIFGSVPSTAVESQATEVLFVGGADRDRGDFVEALLAEDIPISLVGGYWDRFPSVKLHALGHKTPDELSTLTRNAKVNLCLVRRANRDGHVMRSFEIAALGGCMVVEDTPEHREIFGADGDCVIYFDGPQQAAAKIRVLLNDPIERKRLGLAVRERITSGGHTYTHRLQSMLQAAQKLLPRARQKYK